MHIRYAPALTYLLFVKRWLPSGYHFRCWFVSDKVTAWVHCSMTDNGSVTSASGVVLALALMSLVQG